jgi:hypothetical protein
MDFPVMRWLIVWLSHVELLYDIVGAVAIGFICKASSRDVEYCLPPLFSSVRHGGIIFSRN